MRLIWFSSLPQIGRLSTFLCLALLVGGGQCFDYCTKTCDGKPHTMCLYKTDDPGPACLGYSKEESVLNQQAKDEIVALHNQLRSDLALGKETRGAPGPQPQAANMMELTWDDTMEAFAKRYAAQCTFEHDKCRDTDKGEYVGQNLGFKAGKGTLGAYLSHIKAFYAEVQNYDKSIVTSYRSVPQPIVIGHFTQIVWATTEKLGCAISRYESAKAPAAEYGLSELMVCDYVPGGNMLQEKVYIIGAVCSQCPAGSTCSTKYPGLCTRGGAKDDRKPDENANGTPAPSGAAASTPAGSVTVTSTPAVGVKKPPGPGHKVPTQKSESNELFPHPRERFAVLIYILLKLL